MVHLQPPQPGAELLAHVRAGFVAQGSSFARWCQEQRLHRQNMRVILLGGWTGPKAKELLQRIVAASRPTGVSISSDEGETRA